MKKINKGDIYYSVSLYIDGSQREKSSVEIEEWHVTTSNGAGVYLTQKVDKVTWGKLSTKNGDYGFLPNINAKYYKDFIQKPNNDHDCVLISEKLLSRGYFKTKAAAFRSIKPLVDKKVRELKRLQNKVNKSIK